jgi:16S rRNA (guanine966-N2)-methyltransferase
VGLEAVSRGAASATLVELAQGSLDAIRANVAALGVDDRVTVQRGDAMRFVSRLAPGAFDIALADPPFSAGQAVPLVAAFRRVPFAGVLAVEHFSKDAVAGDETRRYGDIALTFCYAP